MAMVLIRDGLSIAVPVLNLEIDGRIEKRTGLATG